MKNETRMEESSGDRELGQAPAKAEAPRNGDGCDLDGDHYVAEIGYEGVPEQLQCHCGACPWTGTAQCLSPIESCSLTPGDPSPAGRCPECDALAYLTNDPLQRMTTLFTELIAYEAEKFDGTAQELNVSGADLVDWFSGWRERAKELLHDLQRSHRRKGG